MNRSTIIKRLIANQEAVKYLVSQAHNYPVNNCWYDNKLKNHLRLIRKYETKLGIRRNTPPSAPSPMLFAE